MTRVSTSFRQSAASTSRRRGARQTGRSVHGDDGDDGDGRGGCAAKKKTRLSPEKSHETVMQRVRGCFCFCFLSLVDFPLKYHNSDEQKGVYLIYPAGGCSSTQGNLFPKGNPRKVTMVKEENIFLKQDHRP